MELWQTPPKLCFTFTIDLPPYFHRPMACCFFKTVFSHMGWLIIPKQRKQKCGGLWLQCYYYVHSFYILWVRIKSSPEKSFMNSIDVMGMTFFNVYPIPQSKLKTLAPFHTSVLLTVVTDKSYVKSPGCCTDLFANV